MADNPLKSLNLYSNYLTKLLNQSNVEHSSVIVWSGSTYTGTTEGEVLFKTGIRLRVREELDFEARLITSYSYEVYRSKERLYWYDDFPHPHDRNLSSTFPHRKHIPPDIKHHRIPAPSISFTRPNLTAIIREIETIENVKS